MPLLPMLGLLSTEGGSQSGALPPGISYDNIVKIILLVGFPRHRRPDNTNARFSPRMSG